MARRMPERISVVEEIIKAVQEQGITVVMAVGMGYFIFFIWKYVTQQILPALEKATGTTIALIDRIRMLDNDMIRLNTKLAMVLEYKDEIIKSGRSDELDKILAKYKSKSESFDSTGDTKK